MNMISSKAEPAVDYRRLVQDERIHGSIYTDPQIFAEEMDIIFHRGWVWVAHESEIPTPGDYVTRLLGRQSVIVSRAADGECRVLFNRCPHRGSIVCQGDGHRRSLTCPYHGWTFALDGKLMGVPSSEAYAPNGAQPAGLASAPRVASYGGFIFASLAPEGPSLEVHLGKAKSWIDQLLGLSPEGRIELSAGWIKHRLNCNWKMVVENQVDGYHAHMVHGSLLAANETFATVRDRKSTSPTRVRDFGLGHTDIDHATDYRTAGDRLFRWTGGVPESKLANYAAAMRKAYGREEADRRMIEGPAHAMLFPNISLAEMNIMIIQPIGPAETVQYTTPVMLKGADELNARTLRRCEGALGPAGFLIADDAEIGELTQIGIANREPEWVLLNRGLGAEQVLEDGTRVAGLMDETSQRGFWRHYRDVMSARGV